MTNSPNNRIRKHVAGGILSVAAVFGGALGSAGVSFAAPADGWDPIAPAVDAPAAPATGVKGYDPIPDEGSYDPVPGPVAPAAPAFRAPAAPAPAPAPAHKAPAADAPGRTGFRSHDGHDHQDHGDHGRSLKAGAH